MDIKEFILLDKAKVRRDSNLMHLYLEFFQSTFGRVPNCAGCSFVTDWQKLINFHTGNKEKSVTLQKAKSMKTIQIKKIQGKILSYRKDGRTFRMYDNILTDEFINQYISNGSDEEIAERKKMFLFPVVKEYKEDNADKIVSSEFIKNDASQTPSTAPELDSIGENSQPKKRGRKSKK